MNLRAVPENLLDCFRQAALGFVQALIRLWPWLLFTEILDQLFSFLLGYLRTRQAELALSYAILYVAFHFALVSITIIVVNQAYHDLVYGSKNSLYESFQKYFKAVFVESARACLWMMLGIFLLVVPGLVWGIRYFWVIFVAQFDPQYEKGEVDALHRSHELTRGHFWWSVWVLILAATLDWGCQIWLSMTDPLEKPVVYVVAFWVSLAMSLYSSGVIYFAYRLLQQKLVVRSVPR